jgi:hypothetical protein
MPWIWLGKGSLRKTDMIRSEKMKKTIPVLSTVLVVFMLIGSAALAGEETVFSGNLRLGYVNMKDTDEKEFEDSFSLHYVELRAAKQVGDMGVFINHRIGDDGKNYLYEGWASYKAPDPIGTIKLGLVPVPFGIFANGLYYPKGVPYAKGWMWQYFYGARYDGMFKASEALGVNVSAAYFDKGFASNQRDTISGRIGADIGVPDLLEVKAGGSVQMATLKGIAPEEGAAVPEDETKLGIAGDVTLTPKMIPVPVSLLGEFINYSLGEDDTQKGNILMGQLDVTPVQKIGILDKAILSLHYGMDSPTEGDSLTTMIAQLRLIMCKQFNIFAQVFGDKVGDEDMSNQGIRVWFMYVF